MDDLAEKMQASYESLTPEEWTQCLDTALLNNLKIDIVNFVYLKEDIFRYPPLEEMIQIHNNTVKNLMVTYALCRHYCNKEMSDGSSDQESTQNESDFREEYWMKRYWFNHFAEIIYLRLFSMWDNIVRLLDVFYDLQVEHNLAFAYHVLTLLKQKQPSIANLLENDILHHSLYLNALNNKNKLIYATSPDDVDNRAEQDAAFHIPQMDGKGNLVTDKDGKLITKELKASLSCEMTGNPVMKETMKNIEDFIAFTGNGITQLLNLMLK